MRVEDLDVPRVVPGATTRILNTLDAYGFRWDDVVVHQSERRDRYAAALESLHDRGLTFECTCSRAQLAYDERYPGHCRERTIANSRMAATRLRVEPGHIQFTDRIQGMFRQDVAAAVGDFVLKRRDRIFAYVLAVVVDDAAQGVTHVVRGADLLDNTPRQIYLQRLLGCTLPVYAHVPVLTEADGSKLAKSARSIPVESDDAQSRLIAVFKLLGLNPPVELLDATITDVWAWAMASWNISRIPRWLSCELKR